MSLANVNQPRDRLHVAHVKNGNEVRIFVTNHAELEAIPPMDIPQPTQPFFIGETFKDESPPQKSMWQDEIESPWLVRLYVYGVIAVVLISILVARYS